MTEEPEGLQTTIEYNTDLFDRATIVRMLGHYRTLLRAVAANPDQAIGDLPLLDDAQRHQLLVEWNGAKTDYPRGACVHELFEAQAERTPHAVAVTFENQQLTYAELNARANQLAHYLCLLGVRPEMPVALCVDRSLEMVIATLAILKAGGAYVPLDPAYPRPRLEFMLDDIQAPVLLARGDAAASLPPCQAQIVRLDDDWPRVACQPSHNPRVASSAENLAYIMYTSGSTGQPKGTSILHRGIVRLVSATDYATFAADDVFLQLAPISFDAATFELWGALLNAARLVIAPPGTLSLRELGALLRRHGVTTLWLTAGLFHAMVDERLEDLAGVRQLLAGGDVLSPSHVRRFLEASPAAVLVNGYGPTENTTFTCCHRMTSVEQIGPSVSIGRPIANTEVYVLDANLQPVPVGVPGELYTGGRDWRAATSIAPN